MTQVKSFGARKRLRVTFILANPNAVFEGTNSNTLIVDGLRAIAVIKSSGADTYSTASLQVFGMRQSDMNALTQLQWKIDAVMRNRLIVEADDGTGWVNIFAGTIYEGGPDYSSLPDAMLRVEANSLFLEALIPVAPSSYQGSVAVATVVSNIAAGMGKVFENHGVDSVLPAVYLPGTLRDQLSAIRKQAGIEIYEQPGIIAIAPKGQPLRSREIHISPESGLVGYPTVDVVGLQMQTLFNPAYRMGAAITVERTDVPRANGNWFIYALDHYLESEKPGGAWFSQIGCSEFRGVVLR